MYIHVPWCARRCGYCDFNTYVADTSDPAVTTPYVDALVAEVRLAARTLGRGRVQTVYVGGGTPTLMPTRDFARLLGAVRVAFDVDADAEITTEANPETLTPDVLGELRGLGVNRLSLGMQSGVRHVLATLERVHTPGRVADAVGWARAAGFANVSLDLIYGTPGESVDDWAATLDIALAMAPDHVSAYSLIVEPGTPLARRMAAGGLPYPDEDDLAAKYTMADERFGAAGLSWYEVSNWSRPGFACRHNLAYWLGTPWWGIGAGAHSYAPYTRWWNHRRPDTYIRGVRDGSPVAGREELTPAQRHTERVMLATRLETGIDSAELSPDERKRAEAYVATGHLEARGTRLVCTLPGRLIADRIVRDVLD